MYPQMKQGTFSVASSSFSSASWVYVNIGMVPDRLELRIMDESIGVPASANSSTVIGIKADFNQASSSTVKSLWVTRVFHSSSGSETITYVADEYEASSSSNALKLLKAESHSSSSSALTTVGKRGFSMAQALAVNWKGYTVHYVAWRAGAYEALGEIDVGDSDA